MAETAIQGGLYKAMLAAGTPQQREDVAGTMRGAALVVGALRALGEGGAEELATLIEEQALEGYGPGDSL